MAGSEVKADLWLKDYITPWDVYEHGVTKILACQKTAYQEMHIVETGTYGKALVLDGKWQSCTGDEFLYHEPLVHPAAICHGAPKNALILGGGEGATLREVLRWKTLERALMVDIDGEVVEACKKHLTEMHRGAFDDPRVEVKIADAIAVLDRMEERWDTIVSDLSDPIEEGPSYRLFTQEYFQKLREVLAPGGYLVVQAGPTSPGEIQMHARLVKTLKTVFPYVVSYSSPVPTFAGAWGFALCSDRAIETRPDPDEIDRLLAEKTTGGLRGLDGITYLGLLQTPIHIRRAIAQADRIYTLAEPPKFGNSYVAPSSEPETIDRFNPISINSIS
ncbi:fused MFS/spermidine synthase [Oscillatoria sp. FACHB-1406]|uniref:fused MFS/spermidine synthase n=1 Tax=Oscillatoria sp. FACHB-1406 TaxID=2692846 RepID=UPI001684CB39|nr:fused MFS/spermidine synthase [Oscillatoria sp. FACHB-1406]MBD2578338.1 fused MFS/spermidine synthase [Oscillatoria sp. FACHB-1406]